MQQYKDIKQKIEAAKVVKAEGEMRAFAQDSFVYVRAGVALNPSATDLILLSLIPEHLESEDDFQVCNNILSRPVLSAAVSHRICSAILGCLTSIQPRDFVQTQCWKSLVSHHSADPDDLRRLFQEDTCPRHLRMTAAASASNPIVLSLLSKDSSGSVRERAAKRLVALKTDIGWVKQDDATAQA